MAAPRLKILAVALLVVVAAVALSPIGRSVCCLGGVRSTLKTELRNLVVAQEGFHADSQRYAASLGQLSLRPARHVQLSLDTVTSRGFRARSRYAGVSYDEVAGVCGVWVGDSSLAFEGFREWEPECWYPRRPLWRFGRWRSTEPGR